MNMGAASKPDFARRRGESKNSKGKKA